MSRLFNFIGTQSPKLKKSLLHFFRLEKHLDLIKILEAKNLLATLQLNGASFEHYSFKVFSQWDEDGILQFLVRNLEINSECFIEFGVEDFSESNCRFLMMNNHWRGYVIDGSERNINALKNSYYFWQNTINASSTFLTRENIVNILAKSNFPKNLGVLSIDVDGIDYFLCEELKDWLPSILIVEYNALFGDRRQVSVPYTPDFERSKAHSSNLYYGASLPAFRTLLRSRGYSLVKINSVGSNAFFVRSELLNDRVTALGENESFKPAVFNESRDDKGSLTSKEKILQSEEFRRLPLVDTSTGERLTVKDIL